MAIKSTPDLNSIINDMSAQEIRLLINYAEDKLREKQEDAKQALINEMREKARELGLSIEDLIHEKPSQRKQAGKRGSAPIKFRGPGENDTWTGRGRAPHWLKALLDAGQTKEEFAINREG